MATLQFICPERTYEGVKTEVIARVKETLPFEFSICGEQMVLEYEINGTKQSVKLAPYIPTFGDEFDVVISFTPTKVGTVMVSGKVKNCAGPPWCPCCGEYTADPCFIPVEPKPLTPPPKVSPLPSSESTQWAYSLLAIFLIVIFLAILLRR